MDKVVFLDRDGVINEGQPRWRYVTSWDIFRFLPKAIDGIKMLNENSFTIIIFTNQPGIARKKFTTEDLNAIHKKMQEELKAKGARIDHIYICPHNYRECDCRKPQPGMLLKAAEEHNIDLKKSWVVGDKVRDVVAGKAVNAKTILIGNDKEGIAAEPDFIARDLYTAAELIVNSKQ